MFAQIVPSQDPTGILSDWWPVVALLLPFLQAVVVRTSAGRYFKQGVAVAFSVAVAAVSLVGMDWSMIDPPMIAERFVYTWGIAQMTYHVVSALVPGEERNLNDAFGAGRGIVG